jgi:hypothetical protein
MMHCDNIGHLSVVKQCLTTAADGQNCRGVHYTPLTIGARPILYTSCRELPSPALLGNGQAMLDRSNRKAWTEKRGARDRFATRRVANPILAAYEAVVVESSVTGEGWGESP